MILLLLTTSVKTVLLMTMMTMTTTMMIILIILYLFPFWFLQQVGLITYHRKSDYSRFHIDHLTGQAFINGELLIPGIRLSTVVVPQTKTTCTNDEHLVTYTADFYAIFAKYHTKTANVMY